MSTPAQILCEVTAPRAAQAGALAEIALALGHDVGQPLTVKTSVAASRAGTAPLLTLHLPVALAASQHQVWCLACQLACFLPDARISVLVRGETAFAPPPARHERRSA